MRFSRYFILLITLFIAQGSYAHEAEKSYNQISLDASAATEVANDTMLVSMFVQEEGSDASRLSDEVNIKVNWALNRLKAFKEIKVETESYSTSPVYNKSQVVAWRVKQSIRLESKNMPLLSNVLGELQQKLKLNGIGFDVSREARDAQMKLLIDEAIAAFDQRAMQIANKLSSDSYKIVNVRVSTSNNNSVNFRRSGLMMAESAAKIAPEIAGGEKTLTATVNGTIELQ